MTVNVYGGAVGSAAVTVGSETATTVGGVRSTANVPSDARPVALPAASATALCNRITA